MAGRQRRRARAAGCAHALRHGADGLWLANTDADSTVPASLVRLRYQMRPAGTGDVLAGTVEVDRLVRMAEPICLPVTSRLYRDAAPGATTYTAAISGLRGFAYQRIGGFAAVAVGEDRELVADAVAAGLRVAYPTDLPVNTSARRVARVVGGGFHDFLHRLSRASLPDRS